MSFTEVAAARTRAVAHDRSARKEREIDLNNQLAKFVVDKLLGGDADILATCIRDLISRHTSASAPCFVTFTGFNDEGLANPSHDSDSKDATDNRRIFEMSTNNSGDRPAPDINDVYFAGLDDDGDLIPVDPKDTSKALHFARALFGFRDTKEGVTGIQAYRTYLEHDSAIDSINKLILHMHSGDDDHPLKDIIVVPHKARGGISLRLVWNSKDYQAFRAEEISKGARRQREWAERNKASTRLRTERNKRGFRG